MNRACGKMFPIYTCIITILYLLAYVNGATIINLSDGDVSGVRYLYDDDVVRNFTNQVNELNKQMLLNLEKHNQRIEESLVSFKNELLQRSENLFNSQLKQELAKQRTAFEEEINRLLDKCPRTPVQNRLSVIEPLSTNTSEVDKTQNSTKPLPTSCAEALFNNNHNGIYKLHLPGSDLPPFSVYCLQDTDNGLAWTVIQRRKDGRSSTDFDRNWQEYKNGFGPLDGEFFIGLDALHALTTASPQPQELWIDMMDWEGQRRFARYDTFAIGDEESKYTLTELGSFQGNAGDSLTTHRGQKFTTKDSDNDEHETLNCAIQYPGGWWFRSCFRSHLNGIYLPQVVAKMQAGIAWKTWKRKDYSLKYVHMAIRPVS